MGPFGSNNENFVKKHVPNTLNFEAKFSKYHIMAEKKIEKKAYGVVQEALFEKQSDGSYKPIDMAKEGMTTLKKHATQVTVICTDSSIEDVEGMLKKNEIPYDKVIKLDEKVDYLVTGKDNNFSVYSWPSVLSSIGYELSRDQKIEKKNDQQKCDSALDHWFKNEKAKCGCPVCDY